MRKEKPIRQRLVGATGISEIAVRFFLDESTPEDDRASWETFDLRHDRNMLRSTLWSKHKATLLAAFIADHPGKRPSAWWEFDAPRCTDAELIECGYTPEDYIDPSPHRRPAAPRRRIGGIGPNDLPQFESQATYLERFGLFLPGEENRLTLEDFMPETVTLELDNDDVA